MAYDKAVDSTQLEAGLTTIADAIRAKGGTAAPLEFPQGMADAIAAISGGGGDKNEAYANLLNRVQGKPYNVIDKDSGHISSNVFKSDNFVETSTFYSATRIGAYTYRLAVNLKMLDFHALESIDGLSVFVDCKNLVTFIIRTNRVCVLYTASSFQRTPIENGTGYVYVPKALVEQYKVTTNWVTFASQIRAIEDYPEITGGAV